MPETEEKPPVSKNNNNKCLLREFQKNKLKGERERETETKKANHEQK